jgi:hypothetical protein
MYNPFWLTVFSYLFLFFGKKNRQPNPQGLEKQPREADIEDSQCDKAVDCATFRLKAVESHVVLSATSGVLLTRRRGGVRGRGQNYGCIDRQRGR